MAGAMCFSLVSSFNPAFTHRLNNVRRRRCNLITSEQPCIDVKKRRHCIDVLPTSFGRNVTVLKLHDFHHN